MKLNLTNGVGQIKSVKVGFSWTTFFFGLWVPLLRLDFKWFILMFVITVIFGIIIPFFGAFIAGMVFCFKYNSLYINDLLAKGWVPLTDFDKALVQTL